LKDTVFEVRETVKKRTWNTFIHWILYTNLCTFIYNKIL